MPIPTSTWKKHTSLLLSRLRSKRAATGGSSLVVQAGFPTSLADLFVKNHKKIKILPRKHNISRTANRNPNPDLPLPLPTAVRSPNRTAEINRSTDGSRPRRLGLGFLVAGLLAVGKRWVLVGITILSFLLLVVELSGVLLEKKNKKLESVDGVVDLRGRGLVSPIREESRCSALLSDVSLERSELSAERRDFDGVLSSGSDAFLGRRGSLGEESDVLVERRDLDGDRHLESPTKKKRRRKKKLFGKLFRRKWNRKKDENEGNSPCFEQGIVDEYGDDIEEFLSFGDSDGVPEVDSEEIVPVRENVDSSRTRLWRWRKLVFFVVVLFGLLGGKVVAVALTLACVFTSACTGTVWRRWKSE